MSLPDTSTTDRLFPTQKQMEAVRDHLRRSEIVFYKTGNKPPEEPLTDLAWQVLRCAWEADRRDA